MAFAYWQIFPENGARCKRPVGFGARCPDFLKEQICSSGMWLRLLFGHRDPDDKIYEIAKGNGLG
jgi:hypothetical protein